jgi:tetratricopeptide (TPR) repeat protein
MVLNKLVTIAIGFLILTASGAQMSAQRRDPPLSGRSGGHTIYGDVHVKETTSTSKITRFDIVLYTEHRTIVSRETVLDNGRYRFNNIPSGYYDIVIEFEGQEVARVRVDANSPLVDDIRQDLNFEWKSDARGSTRPSAVSADDEYERNAANARLFVKAGAAIDAKNYEEAIKLLKKIVESDARDFQAWTQLGNLYLIQTRYPESESDYLRAVDLKSNYFPALLNLGRTEIGLKKYDVAIEVLSRAVKARPDSADANYLLGEAYLQVKKGSVAVGYLVEALRLDPKGMAEAHLRLALLYNAAGMKDKAVAEYEAFLRKRPDYSDRKKLEDYISANKKP